MLRGEAYNVKITFLLQNMYWLITKQINTLIIKHLSGFYTFCVCRSSSIALDPCYKYFVIGQSTRGFKRMFACLSSFLTEWTSEFTLQCTNYACAQGADFKQKYNRNDYCQVSSCPCPYLQLSITPTFNLEEFNLVS